MRFPPEIRIVTLVRAPREQVYDALTQAEHLGAWFTTRAEVDPQPGGEMRWRWAACPTGWGEALTQLKFYVEHGVRY